jgi:hypothetical protein
LQGIAFERTEGKPSSPLSMTLRRFILDADAEVDEDFVAGVSGAFAGLRFLDPCWASVRADDDDDDDDDDDEETDVEVFESVL